MSSVHHSDNVIGKQRQRINERGPTRKQRQWTLSSRFRGPVNETKGKQEENELGLRGTENVNSTMFSSTMGSLKSNVF